MNGLEGVRVLELGELVSAAWAAKLMADLGADVVKVEEPGGDRSRRRGPFPGGEPHPERSGLFLYLNANKRGVVVDPRTPAGRRELERLAAESDVLVHNHPLPALEARGLSWEALRAIRPGLVLCSITPFGLTGPYSRYRAEELTVAHGGGWAWLSPGALERPELPPLKGFGHQADFQAGTAGAAAALAALYRARRSGCGEHVDLCAQAYVASFLEVALIGYTYAGQVATRLGQRGLNPWSIFRCRDGLIFLCTIEQDQWERLVEFMGAPEWATLEVFADFPGRLENADVLHGFLQEWIAPWKVEELYREGQKRRVCFAPVLSMAELAEQRHLRERGFFVEVRHPEVGALEQPGPPYRLHEPWWGIRRPAPRLDEHRAELLGPSATPRVERPRASGGGAELGTGSAAGGAANPALPLEGIRVADLSWVWAGPFCAMQLAHLGAEVIKLESEGRPDLGRRLPVYHPDVEPSLDSSGYFNQWNQGKKSVRLNLSHPDAAAVALRLIARCDVVIDNFATGVMERLGLGREALWRVRPDLVIASISGYGATGPLRSYMAYGPAIAPLSGLSSLSGYPGGEPRELGISLGDPTAGITTAAAICAALVARSRTGRGQHIDVSLWEALGVMVAEGWMEHAMKGAQPPRMGNRDPQMSPHGCFRCDGEDAWITIACADEAEWRALCGVVDPALASDPRFRTAADRKAHEDALDERLGAWTATRDRWEVTRRLQAAGVAAFPSLSPRDLAEDPHLEARGFIERLEHARVGVRAHAGIPWRLSEGPNGVRAPAPLLGADTEQVLGELCGYSPEEIARLTEAGVLR